MLRRRMMMKEQNKEDYDVIWHYSMGLPEDNGFEKTVDGNDVNYELIENGLHISVIVNGYIRYVPIGYETCNEGIYEIKLHIISLPSVNGVRLLLSDGTVGNQIYINNNKIFYNREFKMIEIYNVYIENDITIRIERIGNYNYVYINNEQILKEESVSKNYTTGNRLFFQTGYLNVVLKSIKFKKIS